MQVMNERVDIKELDKAKSLVFFLTFTNPLSLFTNRTYKALYLF